MTRPYEHHLAQYTGFVTTLIALKTLKRLP